MSSFGLHLAAAHFTIFRLTSIFFSLFSAQWLSCAENRSNGVILGPLLFYNVCDACYIAHSRWPGGAQSATGHDNSHSQQKREVCDGVVINIKGKPLKPIYIYLNSLISNILLSNCLISSVI